MTNEGLFECPKCGQMWNDVALEIEAMESRRTFAQVRSDFLVNGCEAIEVSHRHRT